MVKNALFECDDLYTDGYYINNNFNNKISFTEQFSDCLQTAKNLQQVLFFTMHAIKDYPIYDAPEGWTCRTLKYENELRFWIIYEKNCI